MDRWNGALQAARNAIAFKKAATIGSSGQFSSIKGALRVYFIG